MLPVGLKASRVLRPLRTDAQVEKIDSLSKIRERNWLLRYIFEGVGPHFGSLRLISF